MENNIANHNASSQQDNSSAIFGTSSDAIVQGLHNGEFIDAVSVADNPGDTEKIVNEQEQNEIVNPAEEEFTEQPGQIPAIDSPPGKQELSSDLVEDNIIDDGIDKEDEIEKARS